MKVVNKSKVHMTKAAEQYLILYGMHTLALQGKEIVSAGCVTIADKIGFGSCQGGFDIGFQRYTGKDSVLEDMGTAHCTLDSYRLLMEQDGNVTLDEQDEFMAGLTDYLDAIGAACVSADNYIAASRYKLFTPMARTYVERTLDGLEDLVERLNVMEEDSY